MLAQSVFRTRIVPIASSALGLMLAAMKPTQTETLRDSIARHHVQWFSIIGQEQAAQAAVRFTQLVTVWALCTPP